MGERRLSRERNALWDFASVPQEVGVALPTALACEARSPSRPRVVWLRVQDQWVEDPDDPTGPLPHQHPAPGDSTDFIPLRRWSPHPCLWSEVPGGPEREACIVHGALNPSISQTGPIPWEGSRAYWTAPPYGALPAGSPPSGCLFARPPAVCSHEGGCGRRNLSVQP